MNLLNRLVFITLLAFSTFPLFGQNSPNYSRKEGKITGVIVDATTKTPIEYANVALFSIKDSSLVGGSISKPDGSFSIDNIGIGSYYLRISFIGYLDYMRNDIKVTPQNAVVNIGKILFSENAMLLQGVEIVEERSVMEYKLDKRVVNVDKNIVASGGTATDVLENVPSVSVDNDGSISLRGSTNVKILIDGKPSELFGGDIQQILEQIPATTIEAVEIITNPSAKYNPEGMSGIINIKLKEKKENHGINGLANLNIGSALPVFTPTVSGSLNLNYGVGKFNFFTVIDGNFRNSLREGESWSKRFNDSALFSSFSQEQETKRNNLSGSVKVGAEYLINAQNSLSLSYQFRESERKPKTEIYTTDYLNPLNSYTQNNKSTQNENNHNINLSYLKQFSQKGRELSLDGSMGFSNNESSSNLEQLFTDYLKIPYLQKSDGNNKNSNAYLQLNYIHPFSEKIKLESGYNLTTNSTNREISYYSGDSTGDFYLDTLNSNKFDYREMVNALYSTLGYQIIKKLSVQAGLRYEYVNVREEQPAISNGDYTQNYGSFYPTIHSSYSISETQGLQLSYSRRVKRPNMWQLNPFRDYSNPEILEFGNPQLDPEYTNSFELNYNKIFKITNIFASAYFRQTNNMINRFQFIWNEENAEEYGFYWDGDTTNRVASTFMNIDKGINYGLEVVVDQKITKWWRLNLSMNFYNSSISGSGLGFSNTKSDIMANCKLNSYMTLPWQITLQISGQYQSGWLTVQGSVKPSYYFDMALKKDLWKNRATINVRISDIFATRKFGVEVDTPEIQSSSTFRHVSPSLSVGFSYKINQGAKKSTTKSTPNRNNEEEGIEM